MGDNNGHSMETNTNNHQQDQHQVDSLSVSQLLLGNNFSALRGRVSVRRTCLVRSE